MNRILVLTPYIKAETEKDKKAEVIYLVRVSVNMPDIHPGSVLPKSELDRLRVWDGGCSVILTSASYEPAPTNLVPSLLVGELNE